MFNTVHKALAVLGLVTALGLQPVFAGSPVVAMVKGMQKDDVWMLSISLQHTDLSTDHMMDRVGLFLADGTLFSSVYIDEPSVGAKYISVAFEGIEFPDGLEALEVRGHCNAMGWADSGLLVELK